jgi:hypothetical protein
MADTGATDTYLTVDHPVHNIRPTTQPITVYSASGDAMLSTHEVDLNLPQLRPEARGAHILPGLKCSLLSIGNICDSDYKVLFDKNKMEITDNDTIVLTGPRNPRDGLWYVDVNSKLPSIPNHVANATFGAKTSTELVAFAHAALFSPVLSTLHAALTKGYIVGFPGLTAKSLKQHPPTSIPMIKGHLDQTRKNQRSTKTTTTVIAPDTPAISTTDDTQPDSFPLRDEPKTHQCFVATFEPTGQIYTDQTGKFVQVASTGNNYIMVLYDYDSNHIFVHAFKNRTAKCLLDTYKQLHQ